MIFASFLFLVLYVGTVGSVYTEAAIISEVKAGNMHLQVFWSILLSVAPPWLVDKKDSKSWVYIWVANGNTQTMSDIIKMILTKLSIQISSKNSRLICIDLLVLSTSSAIFFETASIAVFAAVILSKMLALELCADNKPSSLGCTTPF